MTASVYHINSSGVKSGGAFSSGNILDVLAGDVLVVCVNSGGSASVSPSVTGGTVSSVTDRTSNASMQVFSCTVTSVDGSNNNLSFTVSGSDPVVGSWVVLRGVDEAGIRVSSLASGSSTTPSATLASIASGSVVVGVVNQNGPSGDTFTADADVSNGSWSVESRFGTTGAGATSNRTTQIQTKITTGAGSQTYDPTLGTSRAWRAIVVEVPVPAGPTNQTVNPTGFTDTHAVGTPTVIGPPQTVSPTGVSTAEALGSPTVTLVQTVSPTGIGSAEAVGSVTVTPGPTTVAPTGFTDSHGVGTPTITTGPVTVQPTGIASGQALGTPTVSIGNSPQTVEPTGVGSAQALGTPTVTVGAVTVQPTGVPSAGSVGAPTVSIFIAPKTVTLDGITGQEEVGRPHIQLRHKRVILTPTLEEHMTGPHGENNPWGIELNAGISLLKIDGVYHQVRWPTDDDIAAASAFYRGGFEHELTDGEVADLTAAGYGAYIQLTPA